MIATSRSAGPVPAKIGGVPFKGGQPFKGDKPFKRGQPSEKPRPEPRIIHQTFFKSVGPRTYAAQVKELSNGNHLLALTEGRRDETPASCESYRCSSSPRISRLSSRWSRNRATLSRRIRCRMRFVNVAHGSGPRRRRRLVRPRASQQPRLET